MIDKETAIGKIGSYYGGLFIKKDNGVCYWGIESWDGTDWDEIPEDLYNCLAGYEKKRLKNETAVN